MIDLFLIILAIVFLFSGYKSGAIKEFLNIVVVLVLIVYVHSYKLILPFNIYQKAPTLLKSLISPFLIFFVANIIKFFIVKFIFNSTPKYKLENYIGALLGVVYFICWVLLFIVILYQHELASLYIMMQKSIIIKGINSLFLTFIH